MTERAISKRALSKFPSGGKKLFSKIFSLVSNSLSVMLLFRRVVRSLDTPSCLPRLAGENNARDDRKMNFKQALKRTFVLLKLRQKQ